MEHKFTTFLLFCQIIIFHLSICQADPDQLLDFCVADNPTMDTTINGFHCKPASSVVSDDFFFAGLATEGNTNNIFGSSITAGNVLSFPGLNTLGLAINRVDLAPGGVNPLHSHPRASELVHVLEGNLLVGFISTANKFYSRVLNPGETFVIPKGMLHFQYNVGNTSATAITLFNSQLPGVMSAPLGLFSAKPPIPMEVLTKTFQVNSSIISVLESNLAY
jgi:quercetin dioxygenase-like cupin family protein